jgi:glucosyl-dolichyl phosphate glucuronosyltransferase
MALLISRQMAIVPQLSQMGARSPEIDFSVIVCAFTMDRWKALSEAVASVGNQTVRPREIIVVIDDNDELQRRAQAEFEGAIVVANRHAPGLCGGRQTGGELAGGSILAFLDDDAIADPEWLEQLAGAYGDPNVLGAGGLVEPLWLGPPPRWLPAELNWIVGCTYAGLPEGLSRIRNPIGANMSMRAEVFARTGGFEPRLSRTNRGSTVSGTCDETEFCIRASDRHPGGYWVYQPQARVLHAVPPARTTWRYFARRCRLEGTSKAVLTGITGRTEGLRSERRYTRAVLPGALARELRSAFRGQRDGIFRASAIVAGVLLTASAYAEGRARERWRAARRASERA